MDKYLYEQVVDKIACMIFNNTLAPDEKLPSIRNFSIELKLSPNTVQKAYSKLEILGFVYSVKGQGTFVCSDTELRQNKINSLKQNIKKLVKEAENIGLSKQEIKQEMEKKI